MIAVAARARGGQTRWPSADSYPFAHTSPVWISEVGSTDVDARARAAEELLPLLDVAEEVVRRGYGDAPTPSITADFDAARARLEGR